jgi:hypothetical protein
MSDDEEDDDEDDGDADDVPVVEEAAPAKQDAAPPAAAPEPAPPLPEPDLKFNWYQTPAQVTVTILEKKVPPENCKVEIGETSVSRLV